jgi:RecA-family ATPase
LLYQNVRYWTDYETPGDWDKTFRTRMPDGNGGWKWSLADLKGRRVLYKWPELAKYPDATVFVCEGEKNVDHITPLECCAVTVCGDTHWTQDCVQALAGRHVFILQDNDTKGIKRAQQAAKALHGTARSIRVVKLPDLPEAGDVSDWLDAGNSVEELYRICLETKEWKPEDSEQQQQQDDEFGDELGAGKDDAAAADDKPTPFPWLNMSTWDRDPIPERQWAIRDRVPLRQAGLFSGQGGTGKSIIELMKDVAHVSAKDWLGSMPEPGPAFYLGAEDDKDEIQIRLAAIASHYGVTFKELIDDGLHVLPLLGQDATLCAVTKGGKVEVTGLYKQLFEEAGDVKPKNISIDTLARAFAGNELDRNQVYGFVQHMQALAMVANGSVTVLSHPSLAGIASGSGISGSTAWHDAFRFRQYLKGAQAESGELPETDLRELEFKKNQYGPLGESMVLRYQRGLFLPESGASNIEKLARESKADQVFLELLRRFAGQGRNVSDKQNSPNYAPTAFADDAEAKQRGLRKVDFKAAMSRLFSAGKIHVVAYGRPSRPYTRLAVV